MSGIRIPFGLRDGVPVEVCEVQPGLACSWVCPSCKRPLQARKGKIRVHHFSHDPFSESGSCESPLETSIHFMAKEILKEDGYFVTPQLTIRQSGQDILGKNHVKETQVEKSVRRCFDRVELETWIDEIRPNMVAYTDQGPMIIEVAVTSSARGEKKKKIRKLGLLAVEISQSRLPARQLRAISSSDKNYLEKHRICGTCGSRFPTVQHAQVP